MSADRFSEALFLSHLPYRKQLYRRGGFRQIDGIDSSDYIPFLQSYYTGEELRQARRKSADFISRYGNGAENGVSLFFWDSGYPRYLKEIFDPPPVLFYGGSPLPVIAGVGVVGTRSPAPVAIGATEVWIEILARSTPEAVVISGFARGIDRIAHIAALKRGLATVAVLGSGLFHPVPRSNLDIVRHANRFGVPFTYVTEFPPDARAAPHHFPRRNRIIAGLSHTVVVMQAPEKSGALITARYAIEEGRDVGVFDHPLIDFPGANEGGRRLLQDGAFPVALPGYEEVRSPRESWPPSAVQLDFWRKRFSGKLIWLGGNSYLTPVSGTIDDREKNK